MTLERLGIRLSPDALETVERELTDDWLSLSPSIGCTVKTANVEEIVSLPYWAEFAYGLHELRANARFSEQVRRLRLESHEKLDTAFVIVTAARFSRAGYVVEIEPNGQKGTDLLVTTRTTRVYVEAKRENWRDQCRTVNIMRRADQVKDAVAAAMGAALEREGYRIEVQFHHMFSAEIVPLICAEIASAFHTAELKKEVRLNTVPHSLMVIMPRKEGLHFIGLVSLKGTVPASSTGTR